LHRVAVEAYAKESINLVTRTSELQRGAIDAFVKQNLNFMAGSIPLAINSHYHQKLKKNWQKALQKRNKTHTKNICTKVRQILGWHWVVAIERSFRNQPAGCTIAKQNGIVWVILKTLAIDHGRL
jgi:hypothetical protein